MSVEFVKGVQELFDISEELRKAEADGRTKDLLAAGLERSCELLNYLRYDIDSLLHRTEGRPEPWRDFEEIIKQGRLPNFLEFERKILESQGLSNSLVDLIVLNLKGVIEVMVKKRGRLDATWQAILTRLADSVCQMKSAPPADPNRPRFFKRAFLATTGGLIMGLNVFAARVSNVSWVQFLALLPNLFQLSQDAGNFLLHWSAEGALDDWAEHKASN